MKPGQILGSKLGLTIPGVLVATAIGVTGCGGGNNNATKTGQETATPSGSVVQTINVKETDFKLDPANPKVTKTGTVAFKVTNDGQTAHSLAVDGPNGETKLPKNLAPGESATLNVDMSKPGKYSFYCPVDGHKGMGMKGEITVAGGGSSSSGGGGSSGSSSSGGGGGGSSSSGY